MNANATTDSNVLNVANLMSLLFEGISHVWVEFVMFIVAVLIYVLFYGGLETKKSKNHVSPLDVKPETADTHRAILASWRDAKVKDAAMLPRVVNSMRQLGTDTAAISAELREALTAHASLRTAAAVNDLASYLQGTQEKAVLKSVLEQLEALGVDAPKMQADSGALARLRAKSRARDFDGALEAFAAIRASGAQANALAYNAMLDACVQCGKLGMALQYFEEMKASGAYDVVSYNTLLKAYLSTRQLAKARELLAEMSSVGITANKVTFNEMLNALVAAKDRKGMWGLIEEMNGKGLHPNSITCSIILKSLNSNSHPQEVQRSMALVEGCEAMDEILFSSVIEACVRVGRLDLLSAKLQRYASKGGLAGLTAPTYGSMIKAYGRAGDMERVRELWAEMRRREVTPTAITLGCMVDALVKNGQPDDAFSLVQEIKADEASKDILNTVIYSTLLKGFALARNPERVEAVYQEMLDMGIACNTVTFNTMLDANVRSGRMDRADALFAAMAGAGVQPDVITYSTLVKGYCLAGDIDKGFRLLKEMVEAGKQEPDEILFNSLLDGCAKQHRVDDALALVQDMEKYKVRPSNFTLSIMVKLLGRSRRLNQAFTMVEETCRKFNFAANIHVYTCLLQACIQNRQLVRALKLHDTMLEAGVKPDGKTYSVLVRGCLTAGSMEKAAAVVRAAHGLHADGLASATHAPGVEPRALEEVMHALSRSTNAEQLAVPLLAELRAKGVHVEQGVYAAASRTAIDRAGRNNAHPVQAAFQSTKRRTPRNGSW